MYVLEKIENPRYDINMSDEDQKALTILVRRFNNSKDIDYKLQLSTEINKLVPELEFRECEFCHHPMIYSHERIMIRKNQIFIEKPSELSRRINGIIYNVRCCERCLLEHFKDNPPKTKTLMFSKGQRYSQFVYNIPEDLAQEIRNNTTACTLKSMIRKWGEIEGPKHWETYRRKQAYTNSFEYFHEKYGMNEIDFLKQKKKHGLSQKEFIKKHGQKAYDEYVDRQKYTTTKPYFVEKYGEVEGSKKYFNFVKSRSGTGFNSPTGFRTYSNISQELFKTIYDKLLENNISDKIYFEALNQEYGVYCGNDTLGYHYYHLDFYDKTKNIIIEFLGDYWHANPKMFSKNDVLLFQKDNKRCTVEEVWKNDSIRKSLLIEKMENPIYIEIWENQYRSDKEKTINDILRNCYGI